MDQKNFNFLEKYLVEPKMMIEGKTSSKVRKEIRKNGSEIKRRNKFFKKIKFSKENGQYNV